MTRYFLFLFVLLPGLLPAQNKYGLKAMKYAEYKASQKSDPNKELVNLAEVAPDLLLEIGYATEKNFTGKQIYTLARAYARKPVVAALKKAQTDFNKLGYGIKVLTPTDRTRLP